MPVKFVLTHKYKLDYDLDTYEFTFQNCKDKLVSSVYITNHDFLSIFTDFAIRITADLEKNEIVFHSSKPIYPNVQGTEIFLDFE